jgi:hypothetical protein
MAKKLSCLFYGYVNLYPFKTIGYLNLLVLPSGDSAVDVQLAHNPKFKGSNTAAADSVREKDREKELYFYW